MFLSWFRTIHLLSYLCWFMLLAYYYAGVLVHPWYVPGRPNPDSRSKEEELTKKIGRKYCSSCWRRLYSRRVSLTFKTDNNTYVARLSYFISFSKTGVPPPFQAFKLCSAAVIDERVAYVAPRLMRAVALVLNIYSFRKMRVYYIAFFTMECAKLWNVCDAWKFGMLYLRCFFLFDNKLGECFPLS